MSAGLEEYRRRVQMEKHRSILTAARAEFALRGFHDAVMVEIARIADVSTATLYKHGSSKEGLYLTVIAEILLKEGQDAVTAFVAESSFMFPTIDKKQHAPHLNEAHQTIERFIEDLKFKSTTAKDEAA